MDDEGSKIEAYATIKTAIDRCLNMLKEDAIVSISNFKVEAPKNEFFASRHIYQLALHQYTAIRSCNTVTIPSQGFDFVPIDSIIEDKLERAYLIDVIGEVRWDGETKFTNSDTPKKSITFDLVDQSGKVIICTLWGNYAEQMEEYKKAAQPSIIVIVLQFSRIYDWGGMIRISNSYYASRLYINEDIEEINDFKASILGANRSKDNLSSFSIGSTSNITGEFGTVADLKSVAELIEIQEPSFCSVLARTTQLQTDKHWFYYTCKKCSKKVIEENNGYRCNRCATTVKNVVPRYLIHLEVMDDTGSTVMVLFDRAGIEALGETAASLKAKLDQLNSEDLFPDELNLLLERKYVFRIHVTSDTIDRGSQSFSVNRISSDKGLIEIFERAYAAKFEQCTEKDEINQSSKRLSIIDSELALTPCNDLDKVHCSTITIKPTACRELTTPIKRVHTSLTVGDETNEETEIVADQLSTSKRKKIRVKVENEDK